jgi:hypothetical protein
MATLAIQLGGLLMAIGLFWPGIQGLRGVPDSTGKKTSKLTAIICLVLGVLLAAASALTTTDGSYSWNGVGAEGGTSGSSQSPTRPTWKRCAFACIRPIMPRAGVGQLGLPPPVTHSARNSRRSLRTSPKAEHSWPSGIESLAASVCGKVAFHPISVWVVGEQERDRPGADSRRGITPDR